MKKTVYILICCLLCTSSLSAQSSTRVVKGIVLDEKERPLANATIKAVYSQEETQTSENGSFSLNVPSHNKYLEASKEGYISTQSEIDGSYLIFKLKIDKKYLKEKEKRDAVAEQKRLEEERIAAEKAAVEQKRLEEERIAAEKAAAEQKRLEERIAAEKAAAEQKRLEKERIAAEKAAAEQKRLEKEQIAANKAAAGKKQFEEERIAAEKAAAEQKRLEKERIAANKAAAEQKRLAVIQSLSQSVTNQRNMSLYAVAGANVLPTMQVAAQAGTYFKGINLEYYYAFEPYFETQQYSLRVGYGLSLGKIFLLTPQVGYGKFAGFDDYGKYRHLHTGLLFACRAQACLSKNISVALTPSFDLSQSAVGLNVSLMYNLSLAK